jgi:hypothetical protein
MGRHRQWSGNSQYSKAAATVELATRVELADYGVL